MELFLTNITVSLMSVSVLSLVTELASNKNVKANVSTILQSASYGECSVPFCSKNTAPTFLEKRLILTSQELAWHLCR